MIGWKLIGASIVHKTVQIWWAFNILTALALIRCPPVTRTIFGFTFKAKEMNSLFSCCKSNWFKNFIRRLNLPGMICCLSSKTKSWWPRSLMARSMYSVMVIKWGLWYPQHNIFIGLFRTGHQSRIPLTTLWLGEQKWEWQKRIPSLLVYFRCWSCRTERCDYLPKNCKISTLDRTS